MKDIQLVLLNNKNKFISFEIDFVYINALPTICFSTYLKTLSLEWLCFGVYFDFDR